MVVANILLFLLICLIVSVVSLAIKHDDPRTILLAALKLFIMIVGGVFLFCVVIQVLQAAI
jgi:hypothetical protein